MGVGGDWDIMDNVPGKEFGFGMRIFAKDELTPTLQKIQGSVSAFSSQIAQFGQYIRTAAYALVGFYSISTAIAKIKSIVNFGADLEQKTLQLQALTGSLEKSREMFEFARKKAIELPFGSVNEILGAMKAMNLYGFSATRHFDTIAKLAAISGESLEGVVYNLNYFTQSGFGRGLARMGVNVKELQRAVMGLRPGTDAFREATIRYIDSVPKFTNAIAVQKGSLQGIRQTIDETFSEFKLNLLQLGSEGGLMGGYKRFLGTLASFLERHQEGLKTMALTLGHALGAIFDILSDAFNRMTHRFGNWIDSSGQFLKSHQHFIDQFIFWIALVERKIEHILSAAYNGAKKFIDFIGGWKTLGVFTGAFVALDAFSKISSVLSGLPGILDTVKLALNAHPIFMLATAFTTAYKLTQWLDSHTGFMKPIDELLGLGPAKGELVSPLPAFMASHSAGGHVDNSTSVGVVNNYYQDANPANAPEHARKMLDSIKAQRVDEDMRRGKIPPSFRRPQ